MNLQDGFRETFFNGVIDPLVNPESVLLVERINNGGKEDGVLSQHIRGFCKDAAPFLEVFLDSGGLLDKEAQGRVNYNWISALILPSSAWWKASFFCLTPLSAAHSVNQVLKAPVKALDALLTQYL